MGNESTMDAMCPIDIKKKEQRLAPTFVNLKSNTMKTQCKGTDISEICKIFSSFYRLKQCYLT